MKNNLSQILLAGGLALLSVSDVAAQIYSFEDNQIPQGWHISGGTLETSALRHKLGKQSLRIQWSGNSLLSLETPAGIKEACKSRSGGLATWVYNETPTDAPMVFLFQDEKGTTLCELSFNLNFKGWRCIWSKFREDMKLPAGKMISAVKVKLPDAGKQSTIYLDYLEFSKNVSWQKMSDLQYSVNQRDFSLIHNFIGYRNMNPDLTGIELSDDKQKGISAISDRLTNWYLGEDCETAASFYQTRQKAEKAFIQKGIKSGSKIKIQYNADGTPAGDGLYPLYAPSKIDGTPVQSFMNINRNILLPLALDYRKNNSKESLDKAIYIYDWFYDQGWADGSGMGTLCFEKLRSAGYFHSFF
ncbi:MAG: chondroitinase family protein, partial [Bacteroidales bacterium]